MQPQADPAGLVGTYMMILVHQLSPAPMKYLAQKLHTIETQFPATSDFRDILSRDAVWNAILLFNGSGNTQ